jgi:RNA polymerase sigma-70 factor, ECF subfamily
VETLGRETPVHRQIQASSDMRDADRSDQFAVLIADHQGRLFAYIYALVHSMSDTEDIYQDTVLTLWRKFDQYTPDTNFGAWARTTARFKVDHFYRSKQRNRLHFDDLLLAELAETEAELDTPDDAETAEFYHRALLDCMQRLTATDRRLIGLCYSGSAGIKNVAQQEGRSPQSICNSLRRIRGILFDCIEQSMDREEHP